MPTIIIRTNASAPQTLIPDLGVYVPGAGGSLTFTDNDEIERAGQSRDLLRLATDAAYGGAGSTLILNDGTTDVSESDVVEFLSHRYHTDEKLHAGATNLAHGFMPSSDKQWANHAFDSGWTEGGALTYGGGRLVNVAAGDGIINDATDETAGVQVVSWGATSVAATPDAFNWIYVDATSTVQISTSHPPIGSAVILGVVWANATLVTMISQTRPSDLQQHRGNIAEYLEEAIGGIATEGLVATPNATPLHIDVSAGTFFISGHKVTAPASADISWTYWYRDGSGGWITIPNVSAVDPNRWDNNSGSLVALPSNRFKKDILHICENGSGVEYHMIYAQAIHQTASQATTGYNPVPSKDLLEYTARISGGVVQGGGTVVTITPEQPSVGQNDPSSSGRERTLTRFIPVVSSSSLQTSTFGRQIIVPVAANGSVNLLIPMPGELETLIEARLIGIPTSGAAGPGRSLDFYTDYGQTGESPTTHQESVLSPPFYDLTGTTGIITKVKDLASILTSVTAGDIVGLEIKHNSIGGPIEYLGVELVYTVLL